MKRTQNEEGGGQKKKRRVAFASNRELARDLVPEGKQGPTAEQEAQRMTAANALKAVTPLSTDPGLGSLLAGLGGGSTGDASSGGGLGRVSSVLTNDELIDMEKTGDLDVLKRYKQEQTDDMDRLAYLDSSKTQLYEKDRERTRKKDELDDIFGDEEDGDDVEMDEPPGDEEEEGEVEEFDTREEERSDFFTDSNLMGQFRDERKEERKSAVKDHWYFEHMQKKESEDRDGSRAIERMQQKRPKKGQEEEADAFRAKYESAAEVELFRSLLSYLSDGESVASAVRRLGGASDSKKRGWKNRKRVKKGADTSGGAPDSNDEAERLKNLKQMEELTTLAELCMEKGFASIYTRTRGWVLREVGRLTGVGSGNAKDSGDAAWEYQAADGSGGVFGPYTALQMSQWAQAGYFTDEAPLAVRLVGEEDWRSSAMVDFDALAKRNQ